MSKSAPSSQGYQYSTFQYGIVSPQTTSTSHDSKNHFLGSNPPVSTGKPPQAANLSVALVEETPLAISINGIAYAVMMVTPLYLEDFVTGFALSEGIIEQLNEIRDIEIQHTRTSPNIDTIHINLDISPRRLALFKQKKQHHLGATGCGLCGVESLDQAIPSLSKLAPSTPINENLLSTFRSLLSEHQQLGHKTGALHAALLFSPNNDVICCMEDIGRHNTLDKVIGYALRNNIQLHNHIVLMSSRCSTELIQKSVRVGLSHLVHLASPSTLAVKLACHYGLTLIHLPKKDAPRIFSPSPLPSTSALKSEALHHE